MRTRNYKKGTLASIAANREKRRNRLQRTSAQSADVVSKPPAVEQNEFDKLHKLEKEVKKYIGSQLKKPSKAKVATDSKRKPKTSIEDEEPTKKAAGTGSQDGIIEELIQTRDSLIEEISDLTLALEQKKKQLDAMNNVISIALPDPAITTEHSRSYGNVVEGEYHVISTR